MKKNGIGSMVATVAIIVALPAWGQITDISGSAGSQNYYYCDVPSGLSRMDISISGGVGDCDMYIKYGSQPTTTTYDYRPYLSGNNESVTINSPLSGRWCVMLRAYSAYSGVTLNVATWSTASRVATPTFTPAGGTFASAQSVVLVCGTGGATIRYTTDGSEPTSSSTAFLGAITVTSTKTIRAKAFKSGMTDSYVATSTYTINVPSPTTLSSGQTISGLSGLSGSETLYRITVPSGQSVLEVKMSGGTGDCDMYVKFGAQPTTVSYDLRPYLSGNNETATRTNPVAGTWFIMLRGYSAYSGVSLTATYGANTLTWPLANRRTTTQAFGVPWSANSSKKHTGLDIAAPTSTPVRAAKSGVVSRVGWLGADPSTGANWGNYVIVAHDNDAWTTCYLHVSSPMRVGYQVSEGQVIASVFKDHLHFGIRIAPTSAISPKGALPITNGTAADPRFPERFVNPANYTYMSY